MRVYISKKAVQTLGKNLIAPNNDVQTHFGMLTIIEGTWQPVQVDKCKEGSFYIESVGIYVPHVLVDGIDYEDTYEEEFKFNAWAKNKRIRGGVYATWDWSKLPGIHRRQKRLGIATEKSLQIS